MNAKKKILPLAVLGLLAAFGLAACTGTPSASKQSGTPSEGSQQSAGGSQAEQETIEITAAEGKKEIQVGETLQLTASVEGVTWSSRTESVATVDQNGLVTAVSSGTVRIRAEKEGYKAGSFSLTVAKAPEKAAKVTLPLEDCDHYSPNDIWGMDLSAYGMGWMGPGESPVEDNGGATADSTSLGWLQAGCKETLTFTCDKAIEAEIGVTMAYNAEMDLSASLSVKFNDAVIDMTGKTTTAPEDGESYYEFHTVSFGKVNLKNGKNVLEIEMIGQGPNMDEFKIFTEEDIHCETVKPVVMEKIAVAADSATLEIGDTFQIQTETAGVAYASSDATIAEVSNAGLVTAKAAGKAEITVSKDGMKPAKVAITVKAAFVAKDYMLEAGKAVRLELEDGAFECSSGSWGYPQWGMAPSHDGGVTPIEDVDSASGGMSLGYFNQTSKVTLTFKSPKAGNVNIVLCGAAASTYDLGANVTFKINTTDVDLTGKTIETTGYQDWQVADLGVCAVKEGENTLVIEIIGSQGPNLDYVELTLAA